MKDEQPLESVGNEALEARIIAWIMGEASAFEASELEGLCKNDPELALYVRRMRSLHQSIGESQNQNQTDEWKLPGKKRQAITDLLGFPEEEEKTSRNQSARGVILAIAASIVFAFVIFRVATPASFSAMKKADGRYEMAVNDESPARMMPYYEGADSSDIFEDAISYTEQAKESDEVSWARDSKSKGDLIASNVDPFMPTIPETESKPGEVYSTLTGGLRSGDGAIHRNNIDALLNNPTRGIPAEEAPGVTSIAGVFTDNGESVIDQLADNSGLGPQDVDKAKSWSMDEPHSGVAPVPPVAKPAASKVPMLADLPVAGSSGDVNKPEDSPADPFASEIAGISDYDDFKSGNDLGVEVPDGIMPPLEGESAIKGGNITGLSIDGSRNTTDAVLSRVIDRAPNTSISGELGEFREKPNKIKPDPQLALKLNSGADKEVPEFEGYVEHGSPIRERGRGNKSIMSDDSIVYTDPDEGGVDGDKRNSDFKAWLLSDGDQGQGGTAEFMRRQKRSGELVERVEELQKLNQELKPVEELEAVREFRYSAEYDPPEIPQNVGGNLIEGTEITLRQEAGDLIAENDGDRPEFTTTWHSTFENAQSESNDPLDLGALGFNHAAKPNSNGQLSNVIEGGLKADMSNLYGMDEETEPGSITSNMTLTTRDGQAVEGPVASPEPTPEPEPSKYSSLAEREMERRLGKLNESDPIRTNPALTDEHTKDISKVRKGLYLGDGNYELGKFDEAIDNYEDVLRVDPYNTAARRGMEKVNQAKSLYYRAAYDHTRSELLSQVDEAWEQAVPSDTNAPVDIVDGKDINGRLTGMLAPDADEKPGSDAYAWKVQNESQKATAQGIARHSIDDSEKDLKQAKSTLDELRSELKGLKGRELLDNAQLSDAVRAQQDLVEEKKKVVEQLQKSEEVLYALEDSFDSVKAQASLKKKEERISGRADDALVQNTFNVPPDFLSRISQQNYDNADVDPFAPDQSNGSALRPRMSAVEALQMNGVVFPEGATAVFDPETSTLTITNTRDNLDLIDQMTMSVRSAPPEEIYDLDSEIETTEEPFSTFSLHVSDASFKLASAALERGEQPDPERIRNEEFYNAFDYGDPSPTTDEPVACVIEQCAHPTIPQRNMMRIAVRTGAEGRASSTPLSLTLLIDNSGSMERADRNEGLRNGVAQLASLLKPGDKVSVVGFARKTRLLADRVDGSEAHKLVELVNQLPAEGGTNLEEGLALSEEIAQRQFIEGAQNRVVLFTDGAANLGNADPDTLNNKIEEFRQNGIAFDATGFGADGLNDRMLERLTRNGNGRYYVVDRPEDANAEFANKLAGAFRPAAENVKVQVVFNPERVERYKLDGFKEHRLEKEDFRNDSVDAAEMAAEEAGVALYQFKVDPEGQGEIGEVRVRFRDASTGKMVERNWTIPYDESAPAFDEAKSSLQLAGLASMAAEKLSGSPMADAIDFSEMAPVVGKVKAAYSDSEKVKQLGSMIDRLR